MIVAEMSMAARERFVPSRRGSGSSFSSKEISKIHKSAQSLDVHVCYTVRLNESDRLAAAVLVENSHSLENKNIFLNTIAMVARQRQVFL